jgi:hypothetical protein
MSYLSYPRINFGGRFFTDPSTVNNDPTHYEVGNTRPSPWQNPNGLHRFQLIDCAIRSVINANGQTSDPLVGQPVSTTDKPSAAKIADLDVYQQNVPTIYGMQFSIPIGNNAALVGTVDPAVLNHIWWLSVLATRSWSDSDYGHNSFGGDMNACGVYQSVIRVEESAWPEAGASPALDELKSKTLLENGAYLLSLRFVVDGYRNVPEDKNYQTGRLIGSIGPLEKSEPRYNPGARWLIGRPQVKTDPWYYPTFFKCPFVIDRERKLLVIDLANGICRQTAGGGPVDLGTLIAKVQYSNQPELELGEVDYSEFSVENNSQIAEIPLTDEQIILVESNGISLYTSRTDIGDQEVFKEQPETVNIEVEIRPIRMTGQPGTKTQTRVFVSKMGIPLAGTQLALEVISVHGDTPGATVPPSNPGNTPQADGALNAIITETDAQGFALVNLEVLKNPGFRTPQLDGQLYFIQLWDPNQPKPTDFSQVAIISCLVWSAYVVNENPAFEEIENLLSGYVKLFPGMTEKINLIDIKSFEVFAKNPPWEFYGVGPGPLGIASGAIGFFMTRDFNDTRYMPVTRDMSPEKQLTILHYIKNIQSSPAPESNSNPS